MRTTVDLPDELYRTLKARAALRGVTLRELIQDLIEQGLGAAEPRRGPAERPDPPVALPSRGRTITFSPEDIHRLEEEDDLEPGLRASMSREGTGPTPTSRPSPRRQGPGWSASTPIARYPGLAWLHLEP
ncbi:MAG: hypothetical protein AB1Z63_09440 [Candidatus Limnocylindrales bacterium]